MFRHAHYQPGNTPLALVWKDECCSQYVIDTDSKGQVPSQQQVIFHACFLMLLLPVIIFLSWIGPIMRIFITVSEFAVIPFCLQVVLELQDDLKLVTSDDPPVVFGCSDLEFKEKVSLIIDFDLDHLLGLH